MIGRPHVSGRRIECEPSNPPGLPAPDERLHYLAAPHGIAPLGELLDCKRCSDIKVCLKRTMAGMTFARPECESAITGKASAHSHRARSRRRTILEILAIEPATSRQIAAQMGCTTENVRSCLNEMHSDGLVERVSRIYDHEVHAHSTLWCVTSRSASASNC